ncbi:MAG: hypothetical protein ACRDPK_05880 [Carbonactinosporaceae bacterium]
MKRPAVRRPLPGSPFNVAPAEPETTHVQVSDHVTHDRHGVGRVTVVEDERTVQVDFGSAGLRRVPHTTLTLL